MKLIIGAKFDGVHQTNFEADLIKPRTITSSATIATQPIQNGTTMSDHMWSNPTAVSLSGKFGLNGSGANAHTLASEYLTDSKSSDVVKAVLKEAYSDSRLVRIQNVFEYIKEHGILCDLTTIDSEDTGGKVIFKTRNNMALENISWTENVNSMDFTFNFKEVITVQVQEYEVDTYEGDPNNPEVTMPTGVSLGQFMADGDEINKSTNVEEMVMKALYDNGYMKNEDFSAAIVWGQSIEAVAEAKTVLAVAAVVAEVIVVGAIIWLASLGVVTSVTAAIFPVGTIIAAAVAATVAVAWLVYKICKSHSKAKKAKLAFNMFNNSSQYFDEKGNLKDKYKNGKADDIDLDVNQADINRLQLLFDDVKACMRAVGRDVTLYTITDKDDDYTNKEFALTIGSTVYYVSFKFEYEKQIDDVKCGKWTWSVLDQDEKELTGVNGRVISSSAYITGFDEANTNTNCFFVNGDHNVNVFIFNPSLNEENITGDRTTDQEAIVKSKLRSYYILVSTGDLKENADKVSNAVFDLITAKGFI